MPFDVLGRDAVTLLQRQITGDREPAAIRLRMSLVNPRQLRLSSAGKLTGNSTWCASGRLPYSLFVRHLIPIPMFTAFVRTVGPMPSLRSCSIPSRTRRTEARWSSVRPATNIPGMGLP